MYTVFGVDPGLVHSGVVMFKYDDVTGGTRRETLVVEGPQVDVIGRWIDDRNTSGDALITIEKYDDRGTAFAQHQKMREFEALIAKRLPKARVLSNTGVKQVVTEGLMKQFDLWTYSEKTRHNDLRSAARIGLYGALKQPQYNEALARILADRLGFAVPPKKLEV